MKWTFSSTFQCISQFESYPAPIMIYTSPTSVFSHVLCFQFTLTKTPSHMFKISLLQYDQDAYKNLQIYLFLVYVKNHPEQHGQPFFPHLPETDNLKLARKHGFRKRIGVQMIYSALHVHNTVIGKEA